MQSFSEKEYPAFDLFHKKWALVTAGSIDDYNTCTIGWGSLGNIWDGHSIITVYVHPARYTSEYLKKYDTFTVSFYPEAYRKALGYLGSHSGRDGNKVAASGLTPVAIGNGVTFQEAELTFLCHKLYCHLFDRESLAPEIQQYYANHFSKYGSMEDGEEWDPHYEIIGDVLEAKEVKK